MQSLSLQRLSVRRFLQFAFIAALCFVQTAPSGKNQTKRLFENQPIATIPVEIPSYGLIFLKAQINGSSPLWFALDSGASFPLVLNTSTANALGLSLENELESAGGAGEGSYQVKFAKGISVRLSGLTLNHQRSAVIKLGVIESLAGRHIDGLVGSNIFRQFVVEIDYVAHTVKLYDPKRYKYNGPGERLPLTLEQNYFFVTATIAAPQREGIPAKFLIDTGGGMVNAVLTTPFVDSTNIVSSFGKTIRDDSLSALGGDIKLLVSRLHTLKLGNVTIAEPIIHLSQNKTGALASSQFDGVIGAELLKRFRVIFDYSRQQLILEPNGHLAEPYEYNLTGISVRATGDRFRVFTVHKVLEGSPGAEAGVRKGDVIVQINDRPADSFTLDDVYLLFKNSSRALRLKFSRGSETVVVNINPRRMI